MQLNDQTALAPIIIDGYTAGEIIINQTAYLHNVRRCCPLFTRFAA